MIAIIKVRLNGEGQKASILSGGDGKSVQVIEVPKDHPDFAVVVKAASIGSDGKILVDRDHYRATEWNHIPTPKEVLEDDARIAALKVAEKVKEKEEILQKTLTALSERRTTKHCDEVSTEYENGIRGGSFAEYETINWPYNSDQSVIDSEEARKWKEELLEKETVSRTEAMKLAKKDLATKKIAKSESDAKAAEAAKKRAEWREANGLTDEDVSLKIEDGCLASVPNGCWESHSRGKNWLATISSNPTSPGGLERSFANKAKGELYYILPEVEAGNAVEFGADYYSGGGRKNAKRWYGFFVKIIPATEDRPAYMVFREAGTGKAAIKAGEKFAKAKPDVTDEIAKGFARINSEGTIIPSNN